MAIQPLRISIVIPVYNEQDTIAACLDSVLAQRSPVDEVVVVNNRSTDRTSEVLDRYAGRIVVLQERRQGVLYARNAGFDAATGDVIGRIDADTRLPSGWVEHVRALFADPAVHAATGPAHYYDVLLPGAVDRLDLAVRQAWAWSRLDWIYGANMAIRTQAWRAVRESLCHDPSIHEDLDLGIHLHAIGGRIVFSPAMVANTSARRIRDSPADFRHYLKMTEHGYASHDSGSSYRRARVTSYLMMLCYLPFKLLHHAHELQASGGERSLRRLLVRLPQRKNPMAGA